MRASVVIEFEPRDELDVAGLVVRLQDDMYHTLVLTWRDGVDTRRAARHRRRRAERWSERSPIRAGRSSCASPATPIATNGRSSVAGLEHADRHHDDTFVGGA